jgi:hypothetical protein
MLGMGCGAGVGFAVMPGMSGMACAGCGADCGAEGATGAGVDFFDFAFFAGGDFLTGMAMPGTSSIFMPGMSMELLPGGEADCAARMPDNRIASVMEEALAARIQ